MIGLVLAAAAEPGVPIRVPVEVSVCSSASCSTQPALELDCSIAEGGQPWRKLQIIRNGGRAYEVIRADGGKSIERTPVVWTFQDADGEFGAYRQTELNPVEVWFRNDNGANLIFTDRYSRLQDFSSIRIDTFNRTDKRQMPKTFVGLCKTTERAQSPLSDAESQQVLNK